MQIMNAPTRLAMELALMGILFAALVCSAMAVRCYNHASFVAVMPIGFEVRLRWAPIAAAYLAAPGCCTAGACVIC
ncbi:MAG: DUF599 family protein [Chitinophagaceae bacterium]|nr:DUF599 family protein [Polaromonas sp.]